MRLIVVAGDPITGHGLALARPPAIFMAHDAAVNLFSPLSSPSSFAHGGFDPPLVSLARRGIQGRGGYTPTLRLLVQSNNWISRFDPINPRIIIIEKRGGRTRTICREITLCRVIDESTDDDGARLG